jgi:hypothetical protein
MRGFIPIMFNLSLILEYIYIIKNIFLIYRCINWIKLIILNLITIIKMDYLNVYFNAQTRLGLFKKVNNF